MIQLKVVGILNSQGEYEGRKYHNLVFQVNVENENENRDCCGMLVDTVKIRYVDINNIFGIGLADPADVEKLKAADFDEWLNCEIDVAYNKYGAVQSVKKLSEPPKNDTKQSASPVK